MEFKPLAEQMRPASLEEYVGQRHLLGDKGVLTRLVNQGYLPSLILWGPPGVGKTTLAYILAKHFNYRFLELSGVEFSTKNLDTIRDKSKTASSQPQLFDNTTRTEIKQPTVVFVDEIHRLNKSQQAQFLPYVERGEWILIGATTENPSFEVISPLLSRSQVLVLKQLNRTELLELIDRAMHKLDPAPDLNDDAKEYLVQIANGDARILLNALQAVSQLFIDQKDVGREDLRKALGDLHLVYDKHGEEHYDTISALHKSMRGSDPNASVYYLGRMLEAGEDPLYVARRCTRFASEDIGNADPMALVLANAAFDATHKIGMPEAGVILAQLVIYLAKAPKSNAAYSAYSEVMEDIQKHGNLPIPLKIRNAPTDLMKDLEYGKDYKYAHDFSAEELKGEVYLPDELAGKEYIKETRESQSQAQSVTKEISESQ